MVVGINIQTKACTAHSWSHYVDRDASKELAPSCSGLSSASEMIRQERGRGFETLKGSLHGQSFGSSNTFRLQCSKPLVGSTQALATNILAERTSQHQH